MVLMGGVAQPGESVRLLIARSVVQAPPRHIHCKLCPVLSALGNRNRQTREGQADYTLVGNRQYTLFGPLSRRSRENPQARKKLAILSGLIEGAGSFDFRMTGCHLKRAQGAR